MIEFIFAGLLVAGGILLMGVFIVALIKSGGAIEDNNPNSETHDETNSLKSHFPTDLGSRRMRIDRHRQSQ